MANKSNNLNSTQFAQMFTHLYHKYSETIWKNHLDELESSFYQKKGTGNPMLSWETCRKATIEECMQGLLPSALSSGNDDDYFMIVVTLVPELLEWYEHNEDCIINCE